MDINQFTELLRRHAGLIHKVAFAYCRNATDREDVVQEIAMQLWRSRERYDERFKETTWIYRISINVAISFHRREGRHSRRRQPFCSDAIAVVTPTETPDQDLDLMMQCIDGLGGLEKGLVMLYLDGCDHASMAEVLGISVSNVGTKLQRIKNQLRTEFDQRCAIENQCSTVRVGDPDTSGGS